MIKGSRIRGFKGSSERRKKNFSTKGANKQAVGFDFELRKYVSTKKIAKQNLDFHWTP